MKTYNIKNITAMILGVIFVGCGVGFLNQSNLGLDPYSCMNYGLSSIIGLSFGTWQMILNFILFIPMIIIAKKYVGVGSFANMIGVGYVAQFVTFIFSTIGYPVINSIIARVLCLIIGVCTLCFGVAIYTKANLGISPYDALAYIIEEFIHNKIKFKWLRVITDVICVTIGFLTGSTVGISTAIMMFFTGPLVQFFKDITNPILNDTTSNTYHKIKRNQAI